MAEQTLGHYLKDREDRDQWHVIRVGLDRFADSSKWYYVVTFEPPSPEMIQPGVYEHLRIPVFLSGKALVGKTKISWF